MRLILVALCSILFFCCSDEIPHTKEISKKISTSSRSDKSSLFEFPSFDWKAFETHEQKLAACEIPDSLLSQISTSDLVILCMKYPLIFDSYAFDTPMQGIKIVASRFNGFRELMKRSDNCICIFNYLKKNDVRNLDFMTMSDVEIGKTTLLYSLCEYLLTFDDVFNNADNKLKNEIYLFTYDLLSYKEGNLKYYALGGLASSLYLSTIVSLNNSMQGKSVNSIVEKFIKTGMIHNANEYIEIKNFSVKQFKQLSL